jgi:hypothetical protein
MKHVIQHDLDMPTAKRATDRAFEEYSRRYPDYHPSLSWTDERHAEVGFKAKGVKLSGAILLEEKSITLDLDVPFLFRPFQKMALDVIEREVRVWLEKARAGEL